MENYNEILALSCTLDKIDYSYFDKFIEEIEMNSADFMSYNSSYYVDGKKINDPYRDYSFLSVVDSVGRWMVFRTFQLRFYRPTFMSYLRVECCEVAQEWVNAEGDNVKLLKKYWNKKYEIFNFKSSFKVVNEMQSFLNGSNWIIDAPSIYIKNINPQLYLKIGEHYGNGYEEMNGGYDCNAILKFIKSECGEFLFKLYPNLFYDIVSNCDVNVINDVSKFFDIIKIAHRHHYAFDKDITLWLDNVRFINKANGDIHNPKFVCPDNLNEMHDMWFKKFKKILKAEEQERKRIEAMSNEEYYNNTHKAFFGIVFGSDINNLQFHVIQSAAEMVEEGEKMHHCVGGYVRKEKSLILSCRDVNGNRVATIEINLDTLSIVQTRGISNSVPEHFDEINDTINKNMKLIRDANLSIKKSNKSNKRISIAA